MVLANFVKSKQASLSSLGFAAVLLGGGLAWTNEAFAGPSFMLHADAARQSGHSASAPVIEIHEFGHDRWGYGGWGHDRWDYDRWGYGRGGWGRYDYDPWFGPPWYAPPMYPYQSQIIIADPPPVIVQSPPPLMLQPPPAPPPVQAQPNMWYYCDNPAGYYPYVQSCATPFRPVPAH